MKKRSKRKGKNNFKKKWQQLKKKYGRQAGCVGVFLLVLVLLLGALGLQVIDYGTRFIKTHIEDYQDNLEKREFIEGLAPTAQRLQREYGILASVSLGQACLESDFGRSELARVHHNLYGVKTTADDPEGADYTTLEFHDGEWIEIVDRFKVYPDWETSMEKHAQLLYYGTDWNPDLYDHVLNADNYQSQAYELGISAYATDPTYGEKVSNMIEEWNLAQYDQLPEE